MDTIAKPQLLFGKPGKAVCRLLSHNGTVLLLLQISKLTHKESYLDMVMTVIVSVIISFVAVIALGSMFGSF